MTRLFTDGAEMRDTMFWSYYSAGTLSVVSSPTPFASDYAYKYDYSVGGSLLFKAFADISEIYVRQRIRISLLDTSDKYLAFRDDSTMVAWLAVNGSNQLIAQAITIGVLETSSLVISANQWYLFEVYFKISDSPNGRFVVYVDGNKIIDYTGDTKPSTGTTFSNIAYLIQAPSVNIYLDDLAANDTNGGVDNSYCGDGVVVKISPNDNGTHNNWHGSDGDDTNNYLLCQEYPKDNDTTYVYHDNTSGTQQQFGMSSLSFTGYTIRRLYAEARVRKTAASAMTIKLGQLASGGTDVVSAGRAIYTDYTRVVGDDSFVNPVDSNPWEEADIDAIEFVMEVG